MPASRDQSLQTLSNKTLDSTCDVSAATGGGGGGASLIHQTSFPLTDAEIKHLPSLAIQIAENPGANKILLPQYVACFLDWFGDYSNIDVAAILHIRLSTQSMISPLREGFGGGVTFLLANGEDTFAHLLQPAFVVGTGQVVAGNSGFLRQDIVDKAMNVFIDNGASSDLLDGHASNTLTICVDFRVFDITQGKFLTTTESGWDETTRTFS